jgi:hypothetical protein
MSTLRFILSLFISTSFFSATAQSNKPFKLIEIFITDSSQLPNRSNFVKNDSLFFQDEKYIVKATCHGEWGGSVWFKNKKTRKEYSCSATCPVIINKINSKYYVTTNSFHMAVITGVIEIDNPELMPISSSTKPIIKNGYRQGPYIESENFEKGFKILADSEGVYSITSFVLQNKLYNLITEFGHSKIYISTIENKKFITIDTIPDGSLLSFNKAMLTKDNHYLLFFSGVCKGGYMDIFGDKIIIYRYDKLLAVTENCR